MLDEAGFGLFSANFVEESSVLSHADVLELGGLEVAFPAISFALVEADEKSEICILILTVDQFDNVRTFFNIIDRP